MNKSELKEMDRGILQHWERGVLLEKIELEHPKARSRIQGYKDRGVVGVNRTVDWDKFEAVDPPLMRGGIAKGNIYDNTGRISKGNTKAIPGGNTEVIPGIALSSEEVETLRDLLGWWRSRRDTGMVQRGKKKAVTFKMDEGLLEALRGESKREGKSQAEVLSQALRAHLAAGIGKRR